MKKIISILLTLVLLFTLAVSVSADDAAKAKIYDATKAACPVAYQATYLGTVQNVLNQIEVTAEQADAVVALINEAKAVISDKGASLSDYLAEERALIIDYINEISDVLGLAVTFKASDSAVHEGDMVAVITYNGAVLANVDGEVVKVTGGNASSTALFAILALAFAGVSVVATKKYVLD